MASHDTVTMEDLADHTIRRLDVNAPRELQDSLGPQQTPSGRPIQRLQMTVREPSEIMLAIAQGRIAPPVTSTFAHTYRHPDVVFVPSVICRRAGVCSSGDGETVIRNYASSSASPDPR